MFFALFLALCEIMNFRKIVKKEKKICPHQRKYYYYCVDFQLVGPRGKVFFYFEVVKKAVKMRGDRRFS